MTSRSQGSEADHRPRSHRDPGRIVKVGLAAFKNGRILLVRKHGTPSFILPGGKPHGRETDAQTLQREVAEELSCEVVGDSLRWVGEFEDDAADLPGRRVTVRLYRGEIRGELSNAAEIAELRWWENGHDDPQLLAPSLRRQILPALAHRGGVPGAPPPARSDRSRA
jgi:8-oxo-dGTP diphosphatase